LGGGHDTLTISTLLLEKPEFMSAASINGEQLLWKSFRSQAQSELICIQKGMGEAAALNKVYALEEGDILVNAPGEYPLQINNMTPNFQAIAIVYEKLHIDGYTKGSLVADELISILHFQKQFKLYESFFTGLLEEYSHQSLGFDEMSSSLLLALVIKIHRNANLQSEPQAYSSIVKDVRVYIESNFNQELTLSELASYVYVSPYHLAHVFKEEVGMAPIQYLIQCRIDHAIKLLQNTELSVKDVALAVGYPNANYFNLLFKKVAGESPGKYRKKI
jgi:YesN/AraC family two-component response regulator